MKALARFVEAGQIDENGYSSGGTPFSQIIPSLRPSDITVSDPSLSSRQRGHTPSLPRRSSSYSRSKDKPPSRSSSPREPPPIVARYSSAALARRASEPHTKNAVQSQNDAARRASHPDDFERGRAAADGAKLESDEENIQRELEKRDLDPSTFGTLRGTSQPYPFGALPPSRRDSGTELRPRRAFRNSISTNASQADTVTGTVSPTSLRPPTAQSSSSSGAQSSAPSSSSGPAPSIASSNSTAHPPSNQQPHPDRASSPANSHRKSRAPPPPRAARAPPGMLAPSSFFGGSRTKEHRGGKHERLVKGQQGGVTEEAETEESSDDDGVYPLQIDNFPALNEVQEGERTSCQSLSPISPSAFGDIACLSIPLFFLRSDFQGPEQSGSYAQAARVEGSLHRHPVRSRPFPDLRIFSSGNRSCPSLRLMILLPSDPGWSSTLPRVSCF
jgi:hypothetical protein